MFARPFSPAPPRHARLFELIRQCDFATQVGAHCKGTAELDARSCSMFLDHAQRSLR
ncbi:hypothetical protein [Roseovarius sp. ZX-A-9]|uniref:hypothetical protein n=1 Tax=Roseovarius sp. ZX-A-9 TaxID=3014783 RepID=UPI002330CF51|nr:hypothetical protein [Roseovarius sp. ZX-A-9]